MSKIKSKAKAKAKKVAPKVSPKNISKRAKESVTSKKQQKKHQARAAQFSIAPKDLISLPAIDLNDPEDKIIPAIMAMLTNVGFLHLKNVPGFDEEKLLADVKEFHQIPDAIKMQGQPKHLNKQNENIFRGWFPFLDNDISHKEFFDMGQPYGTVSDDQKTYPLVEDTPFPREAKYRAIVKKYNDWWKFQHDVCMKLLEYIAIGLHKRRDYFNSWFKKDSLGTFRTIHYLPRSETGVKSDKLDTVGLKLTTPEHADSGFLTLLSTFSFPGLQVQMPDGVYRSVKPEKNNLVMNVGTVFSKITNNQLKATMHRVLDIGRERFSCPFFMDPKFDAKIPQDLMATKEDQRKEEPIEFGVYLIIRMREKHGEWKGLKVPGEDGYIPKKLAKQIKKQVSNIY